MKAACLLTDSIYSLAVSDSGGTGAEVLGLGFASVGEVVGGDRTTGAGSVGRGGVSEVSIGIGSWTSGVGAGSGTSVDVSPGTGIGASYCDLSASDVLASRLSTCPSVRVTCSFVRVSWTGLSSVRLALGLPQGKLQVTLAHVADMSHSN